MPPSRLFSRPLLLCSTRMASSSSRFDRVLFPPRAVEGMTELDRTKFGKSIEIPFVPLAVKYIGRIRHISAVDAMKMERMPRLKTLVDPKLDGSTSSPDEKLLLLDPDKFAAASEKQRAELFEQIADQQSSTKVQFGRLPYRMEYEDWDMRRCVQAVLPEGAEFSAFEQCGHIVHLNLREHLLPFRRTLGQILVDKIASARTVVNKTDSLTSEFRVMDMELLAGEPQFVTEIVEQGIRYRLDYSKAFWNSRLNRVHEQTVRRFGPHSIVFDAFAGVGPFVLPAIKKARARMAYANDLNPEAIKWMRESIRLNKIPEERIETSCMDAGEFIRRVIPEKVAMECQEVRAAQSAENDQKRQREPLDFHAVMNLPGHSADFLPHFRGILHGYPEIRPLFDTEEAGCSFWVHCHFFVKAEADVPLDWYRQEAARIVRARMGMPQLDIEELEHCRSVSSRKEMFCARIRLPVPWAFGDEVKEATPAGDEPTSDSTGKNEEDGDGRMRRRINEEEGDEDERRMVKKQKI